MYVHELIALLHGHKPRRHRPFLSAAALGAITS
eukprot:COSAG06_NODE_63831_length_261_cov_0.641975_1_plen_32_part_01